MIMSNRVLLSNEQRAVIQSYLNQGDYASGYRYVADIVGGDASGDPRTANWLEIAAEVNSDDGGFRSDFVHYATYEALRDQGLPVSPDNFKRASDDLAIKVLEAMVNKGYVADIDTIITTDVAVAVSQLGLTPDGWAGTGAAWFYMVIGGLGLDPAGPFYQEVYESFRSRGIDNPMEIFGQWMTIWGNDLQAFAQAADNYIRRGLESILSYETAAGIIDDVNDLFNAALSFIPRIDPLALDLDGDGIETVNVSSGVMFDFNGDGVRTGTGWVKGDDGFLVLDLDGNGVIDSGKELFGVDTLKSDGSKAQNGFDALRDLDSNEDGFFDSRDQKFSDVHVWRDLNQDGFSQSNEIYTLTELDIKSINLARTSTGYGDNGNVVSATGSYIRGDGSFGGVNDNQSLVGNLDLSSNPFYRDFLDKIELDDISKQLPNLLGSGTVRDLREASMLSSLLKQVLSEYATAQTREQQELLLGDLIAKWGESSTSHLSLEQRIVGLSTGLDSTRIQFEFSWSALGLAPTASQLEVKGNLGKIEVLEAFNGRDFFNFSLVSSSVSQIVLRVGVGARFFNYEIPVINGVAVVTESVLWVSFGQLNLIAPAYESLRESVYSGLLTQTRLKPYMDEVTLVASVSGVDVRWDDVVQKLSNGFSVDVRSAFEDLQDLLRVPSFSNGMKDSLLRGMNDWVQRTSC
jgi:hypothetical protein